MHERMRDLWFEKQGVNAMNGVKAEYHLSKRDYYGLDFVYDLPHHTFMGWPVVLDESVPDGEIRVVELEAARG